MSSSKMIGLLLGAAVGLVLAASPVEAQADRQAQVSEGARVYGTVCGRCHNPRSPLERSDREWVTVLNHMRARANLTGGEVRDVLAFLESVNNPEFEPVASYANPFAPPPRVAPDSAVWDAPPSTDPELIAAGRALVVEKACLGCHIIAGEGGQVGPTLTRTIEQRGAAFVRRKLLNPAFDNPASMMPNFRLTPEQVEAIAAYLASLRR